MPKQGYESITIPTTLGDRIKGVIDTNPHIINNKTQAIISAWQFYEKLFLQEKNPKPVRIGNKLIGHDHPTFIVAEIGINHNGDLNLCKKMIDMAVNAGCDAVKFQKRTINLVYSKEELKQPRESPFGKTNGDLKRRLEFGETEYKEIDSYCKQKGIIWYASPWDVQSVDFLEKFDVPCYKIASPCLTNKQLLNRVKETKKPIILSTGMSTMEQISTAIKLLDTDHLIILHCISTYPNAENETHLNIIKTFRKRFNYPIGYSGHETGVYPTIIAATLGVCMIERHITLDRSSFGSDQSASLEEKGLKIICRVAKQIEAILGESEKRILESEKLILAKLRKIDTITSKMKSCE